MSEEESWIKYHINKPNNRYLCEVTERYIQDLFNSAGLDKIVELFEETIDYILNYDIDETIWKKHKSDIIKSADILYGLIHARYIMARSGLIAMANKYHDVEFGRCIRVSCKGQPMLPIGEYDEIDKGNVKLYCIKCNAIYNPPPQYENIDGAYFGTSFPEMFYQTYPGFRPTYSIQEYVPKIYGFKIHSSSKEVTKVELN